MVGHARAQGQSHECHFCTGNPVSTMTNHVQAPQHPTSSRGWLSLHKHYSLGASLLALSVLTMGGPVSATEPAPASAAPAAVSPLPVAIEASAAPVAAIGDIVVEMHSAPGCGCCAGWEAYMTEQGFTVDASEDAALSQFKTDLGIPSSAMSCHTAIIDGYIVEGHVPVEAIFDLLEQRPEIDGIALPGMPAGSPGMPGEKTAPFEILAIDDGTTSVFGEY